MKFPETLLEFQEQFPDEAACWKALRRLRWPHGFQCPRCGHRREWLYALRGVACRQCWGLCYASQKRCKKRRRWERAERACEKLDTDAERYLVKPKWMRWRTFHRLEAEAGAALDAAPRFMFPERIMIVSIVHVDDV